MPYFPDGEIVLDTFLRSLMLISGIFFKTGDVSGPLLKLFFLNPMAQLIIAYRAILIHGQWPDWSSLSYVLAFDCCLLVLAYCIFKKIDRQLVKVLVQS